MTKSKRIAVLLLCCALIFSLTSCSGHAGESEWGATCQISVDNLPVELDTLPQSVKDDLMFSFYLTGTSNDERYSVELTDENGFSAQLDMLPGSYSVGQVYVREVGGLPIEAEPQTDSVILTKDTETSLTISVTTAQELVSFIQQCTPSDEIMSAENFSRKIQYAGTVMDLNDLAEQMHFVDSRTSSLAPGDVAYLVSDSTNAVHMIVKNTTEASIPATQASCIGFRFSGCNAILPQGLAVGTALETVTHADSGILKTPSYCRGTPLIGMDIDSTELVYIDPESGDRITCSVNSSAPFISGITYEFEQYQ